MLTIPSHRNLFKKDHASHVTMSVTKLLSRIVAPKGSLDESCNLDSKMHDNTYGITSDPLTQFGVVLSAVSRLWGSVVAE